VSAIRDLVERAVTIPDPECLSKECLELFTDAEVKAAMTRIRDDLLGDLSSMIDQWRDNFSYEHDEDPEVYFDPLLYALRCYEDAFSDEEPIVQAISEAQTEVNKLIDKLREEAPPKGEEDYYDRTDTPSLRLANRSIFDDIDE
jgi:hypothetical protein